MSEEIDFAPVVLQNLIFNPDYTAKVFPFLREDFFQDRISREIFLVVRDFINDYQKNPTPQAVAVEISNSALDEQTHEDVMGLLGAMSEDDSDLRWLVDQTEKWCTDSFVYNKLMESIAIANGEVQDKTRNVIPDLLREALSFSFDSQVGHDYFEDAEHQFEYYHDEQTRIPFMIDVLNEITRGGVLPKTLNIVLAGINVGKTTWLINQACDWLRSGKNVLYITAEVAEEVIRERADVNLLEMPSDKLYVVEQKLYLNSIQQIKQVTQGRLFIKEYPAGASNVAHYRHLLNELAIKKGFYPDMICVDYLGELCSARLPPSAKSNTNLYYTEIARELRALGKEFNVPVWTATQLTRGGQDNNDPNMSDTGDAIGIPKVADFMMHLGQPDELVEANLAKGKILKNRYNNRNKKVYFSVGLDNDLQRFFNVDQTQVNQQEDAINEQAEFDKVIGESPQPSLSGIGHHRPTVTSDISDWSM